MRLVGLDVAGWHDVGARDWDVDNPKEKLDPSLVMDGGVGSVAVLQDDGSWVGGPQAAIAPHGLGAGWGRLGAKERRVRIAKTYVDVIQGKPASAEAYIAAVEALSRHAEQVVLNVSDLPSFDEAARARLVSAGGANHRPPRLLWRPVALFLQALAVGLIGRDRVGESFAFLIHSGDGFELQRLRLRKDQDHPQHLAPEREGYGKAIGLEYGLSALAGRIDQDVLAANPILAEESFGRIELSPKLLCGTADLGSRHVVRHNNGNWIELIAPERMSSANFEMIVEEIEEELSTGEPVSGIFIASPARPELINGVVSLLGERRNHVSVLRWDSLARGALIAGRLIEVGRPHYFDRLTPVSLAVYRNDEPVFHDLVDSRATVPANKEFVAPPYQDLEWTAGQREVEFYVLKDGAEVRQWTVHVDEPPSRNIPIELRFRQHPGQSWAKLFLTSPEWELLQRNPIFLDWASLVPVNVTPDEILERLRVPPPTIPERIVEAPHIDLWRGTQMVAGLLPALRGAEPALLARLLARAMRFPNLPERFWTVGTDGAIPETLTIGEIETFDRKIGAVADELLSAIKRRASLPNNDLIRVLTWTFTRCPSDIQEMIVEALEADLDSRWHSLLAPKSARTVLIQGGGRSVSGIHLIRRFLDVLVRTDRPNNNTFIALSMILSRRMESPYALDQKLVIRIAEILGRELAAIAAAGKPQAFRIRFKNALSALAGLFRFREVEPFALLKSNDPTAQRIRGDLDLIRSRIVATASKIPDASVKISLVDKVAEFLDGRGQRNILTQIDRLGDSSLEEDEDEAAF